MNRLTYERGMAFSRAQAIHAIYSCPMHPDIRQDIPGRCPKCGMNLTLQGTAADEPQRSIKDFVPLIAIFAVIFLLTGVSVWRAGTFDLLFAMRSFEGFFFVLFAAFKLLNWRGFVDAYASYDLIAKRSRTYAYAYPLIELGLGIAYLADFQLVATASVTLVLMLVGAAGVAKELRKKTQIPCACLGVVFKLPMTWVTFMEDVLMAIMAVAMIAMRI